jgi:segregation and condensation protein B
MEAVIEAVLFVSAEPVSRSRLIELFDEEEREQAADALAAVLARYGAAGPPPEETPETPETPETERASEIERAAERERAAGWRGIMVEEVAGGVRLVTRPELVGWLRRFFEVAGGTKLSMAALETLAIVAYRQPITGPEIQELRSVSPVGVLKTLLERRLVRIAGRKEVVGKPFLYATTREFLIHFGLKSLRDLPPLEEFEETFGGLTEGAGAGGSERMLPGDADREEQILLEAAALDDAVTMADPADLDEPPAARYPEGPAPADTALETEADAEPVAAGGHEGYDGDGGKR